MDRKAPSLNFKILVHWKIFLAITIALSACSVRQAHRSPASRGAGGVAVNINSASVEEIEELPGIGRKTAEAIVQFRNENGPFRRVEHVMQVRGLSEERFRRVRDLIKSE